MKDLESSTNEVIVLIENYINLLQDGDVPEIMKLYASNAEIIPEAKPSISSKNKIEEFYTDTVKTIKMHGELQITEVKIFENIAIVRSEEPAEIEILATGKFEKAYFRELFVLTRQNEASEWKIFKYMFSQIEVKN